MAHKTTHCSYCNEQVRAGRVNVSDRISDHVCAECGNFVLIEGNARREQLRRKEGKRVADKLKKISGEFAMRDGAAPNPSILVIKDQLNSIIEEIDAIDERIIRQTKLDRDQN